MDGISATQGRANVAAMDAEGEMLSERLRLAVEVSQRLRRETLWACVVARLEAASVQSNASEISLLEVKRLSLVQGEMKPRANSRTA